MLGSSSNPKYSRRSLSRFFIWFALRPPLSGAVSGGEVVWDDGNGVVGGVENALGGVAGVGAREPGALVPEADDESGSRS